MRKVFSQVRFTGSLFFFDPFAEAEMAEILIQSEDGPQITVLAVLKKRKKQCTKFTTIVKQDILRATHATQRRNRTNDLDADIFKHHPEEGAVGEKKRKQVIAKLIAEKKRLLPTLIGKLHYHQSLALKEEISRLEQEYNAPPPPPPIPSNVSSSVSLVTSTTDREMDGDPSERPDLCPNCSRLLLFVQSESRLVCEVCAETIPYLPCTNAGVPFGEDVEISQHAYERVKHFKTNLLQFSVDAPPIPDWVIYSVHRGYARLHVKSTHEVRATPVKEVLKSLGLSDYRNYSARITNRLNGQPTALFQPDEIKELLTMFRDVQPIFPYVKMSSRRNFLNTNYLLNKFCRIKGWHRRASCFPLLKELKVTTAQDYCFRQVCKIKNWPMFRSI